MAEESEIDLASKELQLAFAGVDLAARYRKPSALEFLILKKENLKLKMYQEIGHHRPHLHVDYGFQNHVASYALDTAERIEGTLARKYDKEVFRWIEKHRAKLKDLWDAAQAGKPVEELIVAIRKA